MFAIRRRFDDPQAADDILATDGTGNEAAFLRFLHTRPDISFSIYASRTSVDSTSNIDSAAGRLLFNISRSPENDTTSDFTKETNLNVL